MKGFMPASSLANHLVAPYGTTVPAWGKGLRPDGNDDNIRLIEVFRLFDVENQFISADITTSPVVHLGANPSH